ncbi:AI-2E family transporter [Novipirellula sp. SH528]|uniref:AI-2E family transporter n=1 Tax=Novipirellula sp. SH528 TaxID=3454466 RepID=UPI003FA03491
MSNHRDRESTTGRVFFSLGTVLMVLAILYFGKPVLVPIALSVLLAFILTPLVIVLEKWKMGRLPAVLFASGLAFAIIGLAAWSLVSQVQTLAADLPNHQQEIKTKIESFQLREDSTLNRLTNMFNELFPQQGMAPEPEPDETDTEIPVVEEITPTPPPPQIVVASEPVSPIKAATELLLPIVEPIATAALVIVLVMFLLLRREDVRYRLISLMGDAALTGTTRLMRDTAERVSKYLLNLLLVNAAFGLWFGVGLYLLGVPYAPLWGFLTLCFRFIPFLGSPASVLFPLLVSIATSTGWAQPIWIMVFFTVSELVTGNIIEPVLFGKTTGLTPIALLVAALFWAWVWGPVGLLLSTPLTVCLVVLGQHLPHLRSLKVLLAEQPVLDARLQFFQRLLAKDFFEGHRVYKQYADEFGRERAFDEVLVPALSWTRIERGNESISASEEQFIWKATRDSFSLDAEIELKSVAEREPSSAIGGKRLVQTESASDSEATEDLTPVLNAPRIRLFAHPTHHESEEIALAMLAQLVDKDCDVELSTTKELPSKVVSRIAATPPDIVVLAVLPPGGLPQLKFMCSEIRSVNPRVPIVVTYLGKIKDYDELLVRVREAGASYLTTSLAQTKHQIDVLIKEASQEIVSESTFDPSSKQSNKEASHVS